MSIYPKGTSQGDGCSMMSSSLSHLNPLEGKVRGELESTTPLSLKAQDLLIWRKCIIIDGWGSSSPSIREPPPPSRTSCDAASHSHSPVPSPSLTASPFPCRCAGTSPCISPSPTNSPKGDPWDFWFPCRGQCFRRRWPLVVRFLIWGRGFPCASLQSCSWACPSPSQNSPGSPTAHPSACWSARRGRPSLSLTPLAALCSFPLIWPVSCWGHPLPPCICSFSGWDWWFPLWSFWWVRCTSAFRHW